LRRVVLDSGPAECVEDRLPAGIALRRSGANSRSPWRQSPIPTLALRECLRRRRRSQACACTVAADRCLRWPY
jgi:hypothetical protein